MAFTIRTKQHTGVPTPTYYIFDFEGVLDFFDTLLEAEAFVAAATAARQRARKSYREE